MPVSSTAAGTQVHLGEDGSIRWTFPIEISVRAPFAPAALAAGVAAPRPAVVAAPVVLPAPSAAERREEPDFSDREGYEPGFISGFVVPMPDLSGVPYSLARNMQAAHGEDEYELPYRHFSVVMNADRRLAAITACNIDGRRVVAIDRQTKTVKKNPTLKDLGVESLGGAEASDAFRADPRVLESEQMAVEFYENQVVPGYEKPQHPGANATAEERSREATARIVSRAGLEPGPGLIPYAGMQDALVQARALGFYAYSSEESEEYRVEHGKGGRLTVTTPLDVGSATMEFQSSTVGVLSPAVLLLALLASAVAGGFGLIAGRALAQDLRVATREVRELGTEAVITGGTSVVWSARFGMVARLGLAIGTLAARFRVFAHAQERSIEARDAAARMRGLFFASVSHDLKSPLNAILGFTELVRTGGNTTPGQEESLALIERRGRELLALIETILDAARVDAGQLTLVVDTADPKALLDEAIAKARDLEGERDVQIVVEIAPGVSSLRVDRVRLSRALATFLAYAVRESEAPSLRVMLSPEPNGVARVDVEVPSENFSVPRFEALLDPTRAPGATEHRGLALALRLGRSIVDVHGGSIEVTLRGGVGRFSIFLPTESSVVPLPGTPPAG